MTLVADFSSWRQELLRDVETRILEAFGRYRPPSRVVNVVLPIGALGTPVAVGDHVFVRLGLNGDATVLSYSIAATVAGIPQIGSCAVDVQAGSTLDTVVSICGPTLPELVAQSELDDQPPTGWQETIADPSWVLARVASTDSILEVVCVTLRVVVAQDALTNIVGATGDVLIDQAGNTFTFGP